MMNSLYIVSCVSFTVIGQVLVKKGALQLKDAGALWPYATNVFILAGLFSAVVAAGAWIKALQAYNLSYAYPIMSLSFLIVAVLSVAVFGETMKPTQWIGLAIVILGLIIGSR